MKKQKSLAITTKAITPPPKRSEVISALVALARDEHEAMVKEAEGKNRELWENLKRLIRADIDANPKAYGDRLLALFAPEAEHSKYTVSMGKTYLQVCLDLYPLAPKIAKAVEAYSNFEKPDRFDEKAVRAEIVASIDGDSHERIAKLKENPAVLSFWNQFKADAELPADA